MKQKDKIEIDGRQKIYKSFYSQILKIYWLN